MKTLVNEDAHCSDCSTDREFAGFGHSDGLMAFATSVTDNVYAGVMRNHSATRAAYEEPAADHTLKMGSI